MPNNLGPILQLASNSSINQYHWKNRGLAPKGFIKGMAVTYARVLCKLKSGDPAAVEMAKATTGNGDKDALAWYHEKFQELGLNNSAAGVATLRHLFVLMFGLGMRESSGQHCEGRDMSASNSSANTAEAGLFQTSYNARSASALLPTLFTHYRNNQQGFVEIFHEGVHCTSSDHENFGSGEGKEFQRLSKECPAFAVEFAAVGLRNLRKHWGPINNKKAELRLECDNLLQAIESVVDSDNLCPLLV